ncbi:MAG: competence/damage-inducible protein A [Bacteroidota bacterium]
MNAEIISIGDELLIGQVLNSNQAYIADKLNAVGIYADRMTTVGDAEQDILKAFETALATHDVVTITGGLGPTHDDITRAVVCRYFKKDLVVDPEALENVRRIVSRRSMSMLKINEDQALVPRGCTVIQNHHGTAPGYLIERDGKVFIVMPGVPFEMVGMMEEFVLPFFRKRGTGRVILHRTLKTTGIPESILANQVGDVRGLFAENSGVTLAYLPSPAGVRLRITAKAASAQEAENKVKSVEEKIRATSEKYIYATDDEEMEEVVGRLLKERKLTIAVAESCTGGLLADRMTNIPGSSAYFERGVVCYSNDSKVSELGVPIRDIERFGAVSREVAEALASGIRTKCNTSIGVSTTGIAGPTGGTPEKPVGLVWVGYSDQSGTIALRFNFGEGRQRIKERASQAALELVRRKILKMET